MAADDGGGQTTRRGERPRVSFRCDRPRWNALKAKAARRGETVTRVLIRKIDEYLAEPD
jgi:predicted DNA-binding ribbon-helix-helix protein